MNIKEIDYGISGIYKVIFQNDKLYIGLSNDIRRRMIEHIGKDLKEHPELLFSKAYLKHGIKSIEILEYIDANNRELLQEREKYWIAYYNTYLDRTKGYNMTPGGDGSSLGIYNPSSYLSQKDLEIIYDKLENSTLTFEEIAELSNSSYHIVQNINLGKHYVKEHYSYPIRKKRIEHFGIENKTSAFYNNEEKLSNLINDIKFSNLEFTKLAKKYCVSISLLTNINRGLQYKKENEIYPLRNKNQTRKRIFTQDELDYIKNKLQNSKESMGNIGKTLKCDRKVISDINIGNRQPQSNWNYPLRQT